MNLDREIIATVAELYWKPTIPCARSGRKVREPECSSQVLAADAEQLLICLACPQGHKLAASSPIPARHLLPLAAPTGELSKPEISRAPREAAPRPALVVIGVDLGKPGGDKSVEVAVAVRPDGLEVLAVREVSPLDPRLAKLAAALRELTSDGRMRVSMLDLMHVLGAANYDEAGALILRAGLRTSRLYGPVQAVLVDHNLRSLLERAAASEVRQ